MLDPLLPRRPQRPERRPDPFGHLLALGLVLAGFAATVAVGEGVARLLDHRPIPNSATAGVSLVHPVPAASVAVVRPVPTTSGMGSRTDVEDPRPDEVSAVVPAACEWLRPILRTHGVPSWMLSVAWRESRCTADAVNRNRRTGDESYGVFQINTLGNLWGEVQWRCGVGDRGELFDADRNVHCAARLYEAYGYRPWNVR